MAVMYMKGQVPTFSIMVPFIVMLGVTMVAAPGVPGGGVIAILVESILKRNKNYEMSLIK